MPYFLRTLVRNVAFSITAASDLGHCTYPYFRPTLRLQSGEIVNCSQTAQIPNGPPGSNSYFILFGSSDEKSRSSCSDHGSCSVYCSSKPCLGPRGPLQGEMRRLPRGRR